MGHGTWDPTAYSGYSATTATKTREEIFTSRNLDDSLNPAKFAVRESCDSDTNPESTPVMLFVDVTGSMGILAEMIVKKDLGTIVQGILDRKPITDPHILLGCIGDTTCDQAPIQATQFEATNVIIQQIEKFWLESGGGGNGGESYLGAWHFALTKTKCDAIEKRGRKGYLFTIGDEAPLTTISKEDAKRFFGTNVESDIDIRHLLESVQEKWEVFHLIVETGATHEQKAVQKWKDLLGERAIVIADHENLGEIIVSFMQVNEGQSEEDVAASWNGDTAIVVKKAVSGLAKRSKGNTALVEAI